MGLFDRFREHKRGKSSNHNGLPPPLEKPAYPIEPAQERLPIRSSTVNHTSGNSLPAASYSKKHLDTKEQDEMDKRKAEEVARCSKLLRQMYTLDLRIWGMQSAIGNKEIQEREDLKHKANALYNEVNRVVNGWSGPAAYERWSPDEQKTIHKIHDMLKVHERQY